MQTDKAHRSNSNSDDQATLRSRRLNAVVCINFSFFAGYLIDRFLMNGGNAGMIVAPILGVLVATIILNRPLPARRSEPGLKQGGWSNQRDDSDTAWRSISDS